MALRLKPSCESSDLSDGVHLTRNETDVGSTTEVKDDTIKRKFRNLNEKKRRDQFNMLINELSAIVCSPDSRRVDKTAILEQAIQFLDNHKELESSLNESVSYSWKPSFLSQDEFTFLMLEAMDCVTLTLDKLGIIRALSDNAQRKLGFTQEFVSEENKLQDCLSDGSVVDELISSAKQPNKLFKVESLVLSDPRNAESGQRFQPVDLICVPDSDNDSAAIASGTEDGASLYNCIMRVKTPSLSSEYIGPSNTVFKGKYSLEWKILHLENKCSAVLGYQPFEILGASGYDYYHPEDIEHVAAAQRKLLRSGCCKTPLYRMRTKGQGWVWIQSDLYMCYNQWSSKPEHIECTHTVPSKEQVDSFKKEDPSMEIDSAPAVKKPRPNIQAPNSPLPSQDLGTARRPNVFERNLADETNRTREMKYGRQPPRAAPSRLLSRDVATLPTPAHLNPAQQKLHFQLKTKYNALRSSLDRQQEELSQLLTQLNIVAASRPQSSSECYEDSQLTGASASENVHRQQQECKLQ